MPGPKGQKDVPSQDGTKATPSPGTRAEAATAQDETQLQHDEAALATKADPVKVKRRTNRGSPTEPIIEQERPPIEALPPTSRLNYNPALDATESMPLAGPSPQPQIHARPLETVLNFASTDLTGTAVYEASVPPSDAPQEESGTNRTSNSSSSRRREGKTTVPQPLEVSKAPHISTPPYVHHFDTYGLVRHLEEGGWTPPQAVSLMKAVRLILSSNMDLAQNGLVSKSDVENESYLFSAATSELKTEIQTKRKAEGERSRTERTSLSHEVDILGQRMTQESATMKDELKGMFDDRKMAIRNEQRDMERKVGLPSFLLLDNIITFILTRFILRFKNSTTESPSRSIPTRAPMSKVSGGSSPNAPSPP